MTETATRTRVRRTPTEIAQAELRAATARLTKATKALADLEAARAAAAIEVERAKKLAVHAAGHPDLPGDPTDVAPRG